MGHSYLTNMSAERQKGSEGNVFRALLKSAAAPSMDESWTETSSCIRCEAVPLMANRLLLLKLLSSVSCLAVLWLPADGREVFCVWSPDHGDGRSSISQSM